MGGGRDTGKFQSRVPKLQIIFTNQSRELQQKCSPRISKVSRVSAVWEKAGEKLVWFCTALISFISLLFCLFSLWIWGWWWVGFFFTVSSKCMDPCTGIKQCLPERFISNFFLRFFVHSIEEWFCYTSKSFSVPPSASFHFSSQVARLSNTYSRTIFVLSSLCQYEGLWAIFSSLDFLGLFLVLFPTAVVGLPEGMKAVWAISFKQPRNVYHNCFPVTATMCACAQFTVVVFPRGLWYGFIGCSRCPFGCKCIYLYRSVYTRILENACVFFYLL